MKKTPNLFLEEGLQYTYQAEQKILEGLRWLEENAASSSLKDAFRKHQRETSKQIDRLKKACGILNIAYEKPEESTIKKAIEKGKEIAQEITHWGSSSKTSVLQALLDETRNAVERFRDSDPQIFDIALCGSAEQIELAEISAYNFLCYLCRKLDETEVLDLLQANLEEEKNALKTLTEISETELLEKEEFAFDSDEEEKFVGSKTEKRK